MARNMEIISVGNELLIGKTLNTNAMWIARQATASGIIVKRVTVVADDVNEIASAIREGLGRKPQFMIITGGLGPTFDDKTLEGLAKALNHKLALNTEALDMVRAKYVAYSQERGVAPVELTAARIKMAKLPEKAEPVPNPVGTAPGVRLNLKGTILIALPGVPSEMKAIFKKTGARLLKQLSDKSAFYEESVYVEGVMESSLAPFIDKVMLDNPGIYVKSHPKGKESKPLIEVHLSSMMKDRESTKCKLRKAAMQLSELVDEVGGKIIFFS